MSAGRDGATAVATRAIAEALRRYDPAVVYESAGNVGAVLDAFLPLDPTAVIAGRARLVQCPPGDNLPLHRAVAAAEPGDVLVADAGGCTGAGHWGEILTVAAQAKGVAGLVIDGSVRDAQAIVARGFPVFAKGLCIVTATKIARDVAPPERLSLGGVTIEAGDWIMGDRDGLVVVAAERIDAVLQGAAERAEREARLMAELEAGATTLELLGLR